MYQELKKFLSHFSVYSLCFFLRKSIGFLMIPIYTRYLLATGYGVLELVDLTNAFIGIFLGLQLNAALIRFYHEFTDSERSQLVSTAFISCLLIAVILILLSNSLSMLMSRFVFGSTKFSYYFFISLIALSLTFVSSVFESYLLAAQKSVVYATVNLLVFSSYLFLNIYFVVYLERGILGILYSSLITKLLYVFFVCLWFFVKFPFKFSFSKFQLMLRYSSPLVLASLGMFFLNYSDRFFIQKMLSTYDVGVYSLGYKFGYMVPFLILQPIQMIWGSQMFVIAKKTNAKVVISRMFTYICGLLFFSSLILVVFSQMLITFIAPPEFYRASFVIPFIVLGYIFMGIANLFQTGLRISKKTFYIGFAVLVSSILNLLLNFILIPRFRIMGAAYSTLLSFFVMFLIIFFSSQRVYFVSYEWNRILKIGMSSIIIFILSYFLRFNALWMSFLVKLVLCLSFPLLLKMLGFFLEDEEIKLRKLLRF